MAPAFLVMAMGLAVVPILAGLTEMLFAVSVVSASAGVISPLPAYRVSRISARRQGMELGIESAAVSLGRWWAPRPPACCSGFPRLEGAAFFAAAAAMGLAAIASLKLPLPLARAHSEARSSPADQADATV